MPSTARHAALRSVWGDDWRRLSISATKSMHGHLLGTGVPMPALRAVISNSFAFGGTNAVLVFTAD